MLFSPYVTVVVCAVQIWKYRGYGNSVLYKGVFIWEASCWEDWGNCSRCI